MLGPSISHPVFVKSESGDRIHSYNSWISCLTLKRITRCDSFAHVRPLPAHGGCGRNELRPSREAATLDGGTRLSRPGPVPGSFHKYLRVSLPPLSPH